MVNKILTQKVRRSVRVLNKQISREMEKNNKVAKNKLKKSSKLRDIILKLSKSKQEHFSQLLLSLKYIKSMKQTDSSQIAAKSVYLKPLPPNKQKTMIFDLDETLVHCCEVAEKAEKSVNITLPTGEALEIGINIRPYAVQCLKELSKNFEIIIFTASHQCYADKVLDLIDPFHEIIDHRLYRENCINIDGVFVKDLRVIVNRDLRDMVLVDNSAYCFAYQLENGVPIMSWFDDRKDCELEKLTKYLRTLENARDVREVNRDAFHLCQISANYNN